MRAVLKSPLLIALVAAAVCALSGFAQPLEFVYWNARYKLFGDADQTGSVIVSLDGGAQERNFGSTAKQAQLLDAIVKQRPARIYYDVPAAVGADPKGDNELRARLDRADQLVTAVLRAENSPDRGLGSINPPHDIIPSSTPIVVSAFYVNFYGYASAAPPAVEVGGRTYPAISLFETGQKVLDTPIAPNFSVDPDSVPVINASSILSGVFPAHVFTAKTVFVTTTNTTLGSAVGYFGHGRQPAVMADIAAIDGMAKGPVLLLGKLPFLLLFLVLIGVGHRAASRRTKAAAYTVLVISLVVLPAVLMDLRIVAGSDWALFALAAYVPARLWQRWRRNVELTHGSSGLPNIAALTADGVPPGYDVVAVAVDQYEQMLASLPRELHGECARQIARRLSLAAGDSKVYVTDNGHFVWLEEPRLLGSQVEHFEGLKSLFCAPLVIGGHLLDTNIHFGLDRNVENPPESRIQAALASATEAQSKGKLYEEFGRHRLAQAPWQLSLHARIDEGLRNGDIWLALQSQYDLNTGRICGAEALIRWSDPQRGAIPPDAFILQAERAGRIEAITFWVLERAIAALQVINASHGPFQISVNLSARMVDHPALLDRVAEIVARHEFDASRLTFEVTETFSMANREVARTNLAGLREMGFQLSIDDFGNGQASLAYLAEIPSDEIKLDKSFVQAITTSNREFLIVKSMIELAHALGQRIVAEGVEDQATLLSLKQLNCDIAQGFYIGRPIRFEEFFESLDKQDELSALLVKAC